MGTIKVDNITESTEDAGVTIGSELIVNDDIQTDSNLKDTSANEVSVAEIKDAYDKRVDTWGDGLKIDSGVAAINRNEIIDEINFTTVEPVGCATRDRYINTTTGTSSETATEVTADYIYVWNGSSWDEVIPVAGYKHWINDIADYKVFNGSAWVLLGQQLTDNAHLTSPAFTGTPTAPTAIPGTNNTQLATTAYVDEPLIDSHEPTGFPNRTDSTISFTDGTRTFSIQPAVTSFSYYISGKKYTSTGDTVVIADTEGVHVIYYDGATLTAVANPTSSQVETVIRTKAIVSYLYWDAENNTAIYVQEERHGIQMSGSTHAYLHSTQGLRYISGLGVNTLSVDGNGSLDAHAQFGLDSGSVADEDIYLSHSAVLAATGLPVYYMSGASGYWRKVINTGFSVYNAPSGRLYYNEWTGAVWQLTEVANNDYVLCHVFSTTDKDTPLIAIMGQEDYGTISSARNGAAAEIHSLIVNDIISPEIKALYTFIFKTADSFSNSVKAAIVSSDEGEYEDWRSQAINRVALTTSDHNLLTGKQGGDADEYYHLTASEYADNALLSSPAFTGTPTAPTATSTTNDTQIATTAFVRNLIAYLDLWAYKGDISNADTNPDYPAADAGDVWIISTVAGRIGGASGPVVEIGDTLLCLSDSTASGDHATVGSNWVIGQVNLQPELYALLSGAAFTGDVSLNGGSFDMTGTDTHFLPPSLTTTERDALTPAEGWVIYNETLGELQIYANATWTGVGGGGGQLVVSQTGHSFAVGTPVYCSGANTYAAAKGDAVATAEVVGVVVIVIDANNFIVQQGGFTILTTAQWDARTGETGGLTAGKSYAVSTATAGSLVNEDSFSPTDADTVRWCIRAHSTTLAEILPYIGNTLSNDFSGYTTISAADLVAGSGTVTISHNLNTKYPIIEFAEDDGDAVHPVISNRTLTSFDATFNSYSTLTTPLHVKTAGAGANVMLNISSSAPESIGTANSNGTPSLGAAPIDHVHATDTPSITEESTYIDVSKDIVVAGDSIITGSNLYKSLAGNTSWTIGTFDNGVTYNMIPLSELEDGMYLLNFYGGAPRVDFRAFGVVFLCTTGVPGYVYHSITSAYVTIDITSSYITATNGVSNTSNMIATLTRLRGN